MAGCEFGSQRAIFSKFSGSNASPTFLRSQLLIIRLAEGQSCFVDPERSRMEIVEAYQASISDNAMQRKGGPEKSSSDSEGSTWKDLEKGSRGLDGKRA